MNSFGRHDPLAGMAPVAWGNPRTRTAAADVLNLREVVVLRRLHAGESQSDAARSLGWSKHAVTGLLRNARVRLGLDTVAELLEHPRVLEQLDGGA
jgi:DNA-binding CsgD family transcriptional regulator